MVETFIFHNLCASQELQQYHSVAQFALGPRWQFLEIKLHLCSVSIFSFKEEIEKERASLLASNALLEEQLAESMSYIKKEIPRWLQ